MDVDITIKNYRRFSDRHPAYFSIRDGLTAFIGINNAGKSSLLRFFYDFRELFASLSSFNSGLLNSLERENAFNLARGISDPTEVFSISTDNALKIDCTFHEETRTSVPCPHKLLITVRRDSNSFRTRIRMPNGVVVPDSSQGYVGDGTSLRWGSRELANLSTVFDFFSDLTKTVYIGPFRSLINISQTEPYFDINVGREFVTEWRRLKTGSYKKHTEMAISVTTSIKEIFDLETLEINASDDGTTLQLIINGKSFKLAEVGSGMAQFIIALATAAIRQPTYIFIDEPELGLHPSLQLKFLTALAATAQRGVLFATHNIGLARAAERIYSVYITSSWESQISPFEVTPRLAELLGELSYLGYKDLGYEKILLVEGATDLRTFGALLRHFGKDHQVVPLSMNGTNLINGSDDTQIQLEEIRRISNSVSAVIDSETFVEGAALDAKRDGFRRRCDAAGVHCHILKRRAIENYLTESAIKRVMGEKYRALAPYEGRETASPMWSKHDNWKIAREMKTDDVKGTDLGDFLERL